MAAWTPSDLTNSSFVASQLSDKDRSTALYTVNNELASAKSNLQSAAAALTIAQEAADKGPSRGEINALRAKANDPSLSPIEREQASQQAEQLADTRARLNVAADNALTKLNNANQYYDTLEQGKNNLVAAGTVEPGTNLFAAPPGYDGRSSPAAQVPSSQNPNSTPAAASEQLQSPSPALVSNQSQGTVAATENFNAPLEEPPNPDPTEYDEFAGVDAAVAANENALQEPPVLSDEEVDNYLNNLPQEEIENREPKLVSDIQGPAYDDEGNIMPGWSLNEDNEPVWVGNNSDGSIFVEPATQASAAASRAAAQGLTAKKLDTNSQATQQDVANFKQKEDWRVRLSLAPNSNYLYNVPKGSAGILEPLKATDGVIFPYTPTISVNYTATYDPTDITHSNYKIYQYKNSGVDAISISCEFTAQDTYEANYLLAVIHFFKSVTKMFYGQDQNPKPGTPPPLCYLSGLGAFQFDAHPLAVTSFNYSLPNDVDYIRAGAVTAGAGVNRAPSNVPTNNATNILGLLTQGRLGSLKPGGVQAAPVFTTPPGTVDPTYVPTRIQMTIGAIPIVTRNDISNKFSLKDYATGSLLRGSRRQGGGIW